MVLVLFFLPLAFVLSAEASRVLELSDKFLEIRKDSGHWLVMFYAPWCGHCKRLEPVYAHVAQALYRTSINVGKVDCTRFSSLATEFSVRSFPTIKYIRDTEHQTFTGDRTKEEIVSFALRMAGPPIQDIKQSEKLQSLIMSNQLFFLYIGEKEGSLWDSYYYGASKLQPYSFFYAANVGVAKLYSNASQLPSLSVYKEGKQYTYIDTIIESQADFATINESVYKWLNEERFETFQKVTRGNINQILQTKKYIVMAVVEENKLFQISKEMEEFRDRIKAITLKKRDKYHKHFQFGWIGSPELANSIAMSVLPLPYLLVLNSTTNHHYIPEDEPSQLTEEAIDLFLEQIFNQSAPAYGGNSLPVNLYRTYFEARTTLGEMWWGNPVLTTLLFGLPLGFLSLIIYSVCCADIMDAEEEEEQLLHKKEE
ncbi:protein disulfide-isomerase TMX3 [Agrilus planipennis]|uniref:Protein disulfide-isomerase TMX3 n=1 Tax=Agrilus planipennis TaxID=224129 RepID=A0A1W4X5C7_AGRPL|nr:protein disulfide-isomerase TMX3 [Agrilus planipennis]